MERNLQFEVPIGWDGLSGSRNLNRVLPSHLLIARNISYFGGAISREGGSTKYNTTAITGSPKIRGGRDWYTGIYHRQVVCVDTGSEEKLLKDTGDAAFSVTLKAGLTSGAKVCFVEGGIEATARARKLFFFNGKNTPQVLAGDGAATTDIGAGHTKAPAALTAALAGAVGNVDNGTHSYKVTFVDEAGETEAGAKSNVITIADKTVNGQVNLTFIPVSTDITVIARKIYRTVAGDVSNHKLLTIISNNTATTYTDNIADSGLGADAPTANTTSTKPTDWAGDAQPSFGVIHEGRLFAGGNNNAPHTIYFSTMANHEDFADAGSGIGQIFSGVGEGLIGGVSFKGYLVLWKYPKGIFIVDTADASPSGWRILQLTDKVGGVAQGGILQLEDDVVFLDASGNFQSLGAVEAYGDVAAKNISAISEIGTWFSDNINLLHLDKVQSIWYSKKREAYFALPASGSTENTLSVVLDFNEQNKIKFRESEKDRPLSLWLTEDSLDKIWKPYCGDLTGFVWKLDQDTKNVDGGGYDSRFRTPPLTFDYIDKAIASKLKVGQFLEVDYTSNATYFLSVDVYWDGEYRYTTALDLSAAAAVLGSFVLDTDKLAGNSVSTIRKRLYGSGRALALEFYTTGANQDFSISRVIIHCKIGEYRAP